MATRRKNAATETVEETPAVSTDFSFENLVPEEAATPTKAGYGRTVPENILAALNDSAQNYTERGNGWVGAGRAYTVPSETAKKLIGVLRKGAEQLGYGLTVQPEQANEDGSLTRVVFAVKSKRAYTRKTADETVEE